MTKKTLGSFIAIAVFLIGGLFLSSSVYTVDQTEYAILVTFGEPGNTIINPGLRFKLPYPIQQVKKVSRETFSLTFGYEERGGQVTTNNKEAKMITGDENIILADLEVQWRIVDPVAFLYHTNDPVNVLYNATSSSLRGVIGSSTVDDALTDGRARIINDVRENLSSLLGTYDIGISIENVNLQDVDLPNEEVSNAFKKVTSAREERVTKINEANRYRNEKLNTAEGQKEAIISVSEGQKVERIEAARGNIATFEALYAGYVNNKEITRERLMIEALEQVLPRVKIFIMDESEGGNTVKYLPIETAKGGTN